MTAWYEHVPQPRLEQRQLAGPVKVVDRPRLDRRLAMTESRPSWDKVAALGGATPAI